MLLMKRFRDENDLISASSSDGVIQRTHIFNIQFIQPFAVLQKCREQFWILRKRQQLLWLVAARELQNKSILRHQQIEPAQISCRGNHVTVQIIHTLTE